MTQDTVEREREVARIIDSVAFSPETVKMEAEMDRDGQAHMWAERREWALQRARAIIALPTTPASATDAAERVTEAQVETLLQDLLYKHDPMCGRDDCRYIASKIAAPILAALSLPQQGWRTIESAPKDGAIVDLWTSAGRRLSDASWCKQRRTWVVDKGPREPYEIHEQPTHWMPLPTPPTDEGEGL